MFFEACFKYFSSFCWWYCFWGPLWLFLGISAVFSCGFLRLLKSFFVMFFVGFLGCFFWGVSWMIVWLLLVFPMRFIYASKFQNVRTRANICKHVQERADMCQTCKQCAKLCDTMRAMNEFNLTDLKGLKWSWCKSRRAHKTVVSSSFSFQQPQWLVLGHMATKEHVKNQKHYHFLSRLTFQAVSTQWKENLNDWNVSNLICLLQETPEEHMRVKNKQENIHVRNIR